MELDSARWARIELLYEEAMARPSLERIDFARSACGPDAALFHELQDMLVAEDTGTALAIERLVSDAGDDAAADPLLGSTIGAWRLVRPLGRGNTSRVYLVERADGQYEQRAALKLIAGPLPREIVERFRVERRILARLVHANIARLIDGGYTTEGTPYLVMEYVDGTALTTYGEEQQLALEERLRLFQIVCRAVQHAHRALVVHRDLKPSNIYVSSAGDVKLLDFGIAKLLEADDAGSPMPETRTEFRALTPAYAAPEQIQGDAITTATDVYALGVVLYELTTGQRPFDLAGLSPADTERVIVEREPPPPSAALAAAGDRRLARRVRGDLDRICLMALRKDPARRYGSAAQLADDVDRFLNGRPVAAQPDSIRYRVRRFVARNRISVAAAAAFVVLLGAFAGVATVQARAIASERDSARRERDKARNVVDVLVDLFQSANPEIVPGGDKLSIGDFLTGAESRVMRGLETRADVRAEMKHVLGQMHEARSDYAKSKLLLEQALVESRQVNGADAIETITVEVDLGVLLVTMGNESGARPILADAVARSVRALGERHALTGKALHMLATTYAETSNEAKTYLARALAIDRAVLAPDDPELAYTLNDLAVIAMSESRYADASRLFEEGLLVANRSHGGLNFVAHMLVSNLATLRMRLGDYAGAETLYRRAMEIGVEQIGPRSLQVAIDYGNLAIALESQGRFDSGLPLLREAYDRHLELLGPAHARVANDARNIGIALRLLERPAEARPWLEQAVRVHTAADGADSRNTVYIRAQLASVLFQLGSRDEALRMLDAAVKRLEELTPAGDHDTLADVRLFFGHALVDAGRAAQAEAPLRAAAAFRARVLAEGHPLRAVADCELARDLAALGRDADARPLLERCVPRVRAYPLADRTLREQASALLGR